MVNVALVSTSANVLTMQLDPAFVRGAVCVCVCDMCWKHSKLPLLMQFSAGLDTKLK